jgi:hypothetical protein
MGGMLRFKKAAALTGALAVATLVLAACVGGPPPPPPTDPHDVLVVGDSISFSFACGLGDDAGSGQSCPAPGGITTKSDVVGGCTISGGTILLYNGTTVDTYGCDDWPSKWAADADMFTPKVVVIVTSGWEIMDRWSGGPNGLPDRQWGGGTANAPDGPAQAASSAYQANLTAAINLFRQRGAKVVVANSAYVNPPVPEFPPGTPGAPDFLINAWYERYPLTNTTTPPDIWNPPIAGMTYRPSKTKVEQFNNAITNVVNQFGDPGSVLKFNFFKHFDPVISGSTAYSDYICPPPNDTADPATCSGNKILARENDGGHLTSPGGQGILNTYLQPCVEAVLAGSSTASCQ